MIRCSECDQLQKFGMRNVFTGREKVFYECKAYHYCWRLMSKIPKTHPRWCPRYKEVKRDE